MPAPLVVRAWRAPLLRAPQTPLEPLPPVERRPARAGQKRATRPAWAADGRATGRAPGRPPRQAPSSAHL